MGMYTCFKFMGIVKKEYRDMIDKICNQYKDWGEFTEYKFLENFIKLSHSHMIPYGAMSACNEDKFGDSYCDFNEGLREWNFLCDFKNGGEIQTFINEVVPHLCEYVRLCLVWYEEQERPDIYVWNKERKCLELLHEGEMIDYGYGF